MKNIFKKISVVLLVAILLCTAVGCSGNKAKENGNKVTLNTDVAEGVDTAEQIALQQEIKGKGGKVTLLAPFSETSVKGQCLTQQFKAMCGGTLEIVTVDYSDMKQKIVSMQQSGNAPDVYFMTNQDFPSLMYKDILLPLSDKIDFESPVFDSIRDDLNNLTWDGETYFIPEVDVGRAIWWNRSLFEQAGIPASEMPDALVESNDWTWDTFYDLMKRVAKPEEGIYGFDCGPNLCYQLPATTGEDIIKIGDNGLESNVNSANITRSLNFFKKVMTSESYAPANSNDVDMFIKGRVAMIYDQIITDDSRAADMLRDGTIEYTYFPRDPQQDEYINMGSIQGYAIPIGTKNTEGAVAFLKMLKASDFYQKQVDDINNQNDNLDEKTIAFIKDLENTKKVPCLSLGIKEIQSLFWNATGQDLVTGATTWETVAASIGPEIQKQLDMLG